MSTSSPSAYLYDFLTSTPAAIMRTSVMARAVSMYRQHGFREGQAYSSLPERVPSVLTLEKRVA